MLVSGKIRGSRITSKRRCFNKKFETRVPNIYSRERRIRYGGQSFSRLIILKGMIGKTPIMGGKGESSTLKLYDDPWIPEDSFLK
jgi:hypothetical protein